MALTPGRDSTEYARARRATACGELVLALGALTAIAGGALRTSLADVGLGLAAIGAFIISASVWAYASSRGRAKASAAAPKMDVRLSTPRI